MSKKKLITKKPKKRKAIPGRPGSEDRIHGENYNTDIPYGYLAKGLNTPKKNKQMKGTNNVA